MRFEINLAKTGQFYFLIISDNNKVVAQSEMYESKQAAKKTINSIIQEIRNVPSDLTESYIKDNTLTK